jgi:hypothetical protein
MSLQRRLLNSNQQYGDRFELRIRFLREEKSFYYKILDQRHIRLYTL